MLAHSRHGKANEAAARPVPRGLTCQELFRDTAAEAERKFKGLMRPVKFESGAPLFVEGQDPLRVFLIQTGRVRVIVSYADGSSTTIRTALPGEIVGVVSAISGRPHPWTAVTDLPSELGVIERQELLRFAREHGEIVFRVLEILSVQMNAALERIREHPALKKCACGRGLDYDPYGGPFGVAI